jgi:hypothetical protein
MDGLFRIVEFLIWRILLWSFEVALQVSLALLRAALPATLEFLVVATRVAGRLLEYPESWTIIAVIVLWSLTDHGVLAISAGVGAVAAVLAGSLIRERVW